ncbi:MAG: potassium channel family protein [Pseudomonadota bacterium]
MIALILAASVAALAVLLNFEALLLIDKVARRIAKPRKALVTIWLGLLTAHSIEIWLYAGAYWLSVQLGFGELQGVVSDIDYVYFSSVVYSTLGFGDILPSQPLRMLAGTEAVVGLCLIAWSATATYSFMQEHMSKLK